MSYAPDQTWDLDSIVAGGPGGEPFREALARVRARLDALVARADALGGIDAQPAEWKRLLHDVDEATQDLVEFSSYAGCAAAADARSVDARQAQAAADELLSRLERIQVPLKAKLRETDEATLDAFLVDPDVAERAHALRHAREEARLELPRQLQELVVEMERESLHGWGQLYEQVSGALETEIEHPTEGKQTVGIAALRSYGADGDERVRRAAFDAGQRGWGSIADVCAAALTHITGARQTHQDRVGYDELAPTLHRNRLAPATLDAIWAACEHAKPALVRYLDRKARLLGKERLDWWDLAAPLPATPAAKLDWERAQSLVVDTFRGYDPALADFAVHALKQRWIEAERRPGKQQGGFCASLPRSRASRIFMTYGGDLDSTLTMAHELGHAWHNHLLFDEPFTRRHITSSLAETASTFAEQVVRDRALASAKTDTERLVLLDQRIQDGVAFLMNIPTRFAFERRLFALRREGPFDAALLSHEMVEAQRQAYGDALASWDPTFWASKLHFYISWFGFYNWPYTFGYLFSGAVYRRAMEEGPDWRREVVRLLKLTGYEQTEVIGREVLGEDLTDPDFWKRATAGVLADVEAFLERTA